jgi:hypothetical protein
MFILAQRRRRHRHLRELERRADRRPRRRAVEALGDDAIRAALATFWTRTGRPPTNADVADPGWPGPCVQTLRRRFGGLAEAWQRLGPVPPD